MKAKYIYLMMAGAFLLASCNNEDTPLQAGQDSDAPAMNLPEGTFVVDYTASTDGAASRSANGMISSLDYLLYESTDGSTYRLTKRVEIPDIDKGKTNWPLIRENMTWAQREALKDTLNTSNSYKAVFVANADAEKVWNGETVLTNVDLGSDFTAARLNLPTTKPFDESNMYFMDVVEINENRNQADKGSLNKQILLERVINKIEVKLDEEIASAEDLDAYVTQKLGDFYDANYVKDDNQGALDKVVWAYMGDISSKITNLGAGISTTNKAKKDFRDKFINPDDKRKAVVESIKVCSESSPCTADNYCVKHWLINKMKLIFMLHCNWTDIQSVDVEYDKADYPTSIDFYKFYRAESQNDNISVTALKVEDNSYIWYTFGTNGDNTSSLGKVSSLKFKDNKGSEVFSSSCGKIPGTNLSGGNWSLELVYNPIAAMSVGVADPENPYTREQYNIQNVLGWTWKEFGYDLVWTEEKMIKWVNSLFSESESESKFTPYTLSLSIPLISIVDVDSWETGKAGN